MRFDSSKTILASRTAFSNAQATKITWYFDSFAARAPVCLRKGPAWATLQGRGEALGGVGREHVGKRGADEHVTVAARRVHAIAAERLIAEASVVAEKPARPERPPGARQAIGGQPLDALDRAQRNLDGTDEAIDRQASIRDRVSARGQKEGENER